MWRVTSKSVVPEPLIFSTTDLSLRYAASKLLGKSYAPVGPTYSYVCSPRIFEGRSLNCLDRTTPPMTSQNELFS